MKLQSIESMMIGEINYIDIICKNWPQISLFHYTSIEKEDRGTFFKENDFDEEHNITNFIWYLLIKASDIFYEKEKRFPGQGSHDKFDKDINDLRDALNIYLTNKLDNLPFDSSRISDEYLYEFCRMSNSKMVPAISIISSIASQEIIKLITYQFESINNTVIFDGIHSTISTFKV